MLNKNNIDESSSHYISDDVIIYDQWEFTILTFQPITAKQSKWRAILLYKSSSSLYYKSAPLYYKRLMTNESSPFWCFDQSQRRSVKEPFYYIWLHHRYIIKVLLNIDESSLYKWWRHHHHLDATRRDMFRELFYYIRLHHRYIIKVLFKYKGHSCHSGRKKCQMEMSNAKCHIVKCQMS